MNWPHFDPKALRRARYHRYCRRRAPKRQTKRKAERPYTLIFRPWPLAALRSLWGL